jgi:hypothetical protein
MKLVRTRVTAAEDELLRRRVRIEGTTMQGWIRRAIRAQLLADKVDPSDPLFTAFPLVQGKGPKRDVAERHDEILYGPLK